MYALALAPLISRLSGLVATGWRVFRNRRQVAELTTWSDEQLRDIGLTRGDVRAAMGVPLFRDPSSVLNEGRSARPAGRGDEARSDPASGAMVIAFGDAASGRKARVPAARLAL
ncbi:DUF1127 domain-containing protein [Microvirga tunisiensis]|uniref:DUF1127 domain-containing protein n=2 Tax=Pannonibacter tanglangensis TaxID=2750084 RepID=A0A7X5F3F6_9HYPH|nr:MULTISPECIES: DUF1127 domain-containing protein [unclassified Pannonibacter]NBN64524.1 DUF1127 domain-containing protein [Pannonibacter sp. XCT-34]NBN79058.1 DUF1127 domain-containing protein [Pannonibacter sp. XCT-53]